MGRGGSWRGIAMMLTLILVHNGDMQDSIIRSVRGNSTQPSYSTQALLTW
jgi:hypothetical protein